MTRTTHPPADARRVIGGVDTHKDVHVGAVLDDNGRLLDTGSFPTTTAGYRQLWRWMCGHGDVVAVGIEGTGAWGAGLSRYLAAQGVDVREVMRPNRQHRRRYGKSDEADAIGAARAVLAGEAIGTAKSQIGTVEAIRLLRIARRSAMKAAPRPATRSTPSSTPPRSRCGDVSSADRPSTSSPRSPSSVAVTCPTPARSRPAHAAHPRPPLE